MAEIKGLVDDNGTIFQCNKILPEEYVSQFFEVLTELEDNECHRTKQFPKSKLHKVTGAKNVYRVYIDKISGWRMHVLYLYGEDKRIHLCEVLPPKEHDRVLSNIKSKKNKYKK